MEEQLPEKFQEPGVWMSAAPSIAQDCIIVINCGSSSLKFAVFDMDGKTVLLKGLAERLGSPEAALKIERDGETTFFAMPLATHHSALQAAIEKMTGLKPRGIGHRVVHGADFFTDSVVITEEVIHAVDRCSSLAPLHNPASIVGIRTASELFPKLPQVAVFDTAFHQTLPPQAFFYAIPYKYYEELKVRRYGFHGTSHHYVALKAARRLGRNLDESSLITLHLGNGCSACAIRNGRSVDTTMGLTPSEGLVMGTRSGDVDPALHQYLQDQTGMRLSEITQMLNSKSGLLGLSGLSSDMRTLSEAADSGHARAKLAIEVFCYRLAKSVCGLTAALDTLDALIFTGGIGENNAAVRAKTTSYLKFIGVVIDDEKNTTHGRADSGRISASSSRVTCLVIPTDEERMIARETLRLIA